MRVAVVEGLLLNCNMLHMVLYHQVHENGIEKKKLLVRLSPMSCFWHDAPAGTE